MRWVNDTNFVWRVSTSDITEPLVLNLMQYWDGRCGADIPHRRDLDPVSEIPHLVPNLMLTELVDNPRGYVYRVVGDAIAERYRCSLAGRRLEDVIGDASVPLTRLYEDCIGERRPVCVFGHYDWTDRNFMTFEAAICPLADDMGRVGKILTGIAYHKRSRWTPERPLLRGRLQQPLELMVQAS
jgi:hypothetical protein